MANIEQGSRELQQRICQLRYLDGGILQRVGAYFD